jgi:hypothetical protein
MTDNHEQNSWPVWATESIKMKDFDPSWKKIKQNTPYPRGGRALGETAFVSGSLKRKCSFSGGIQKS